MSILHFIFALWLCANYLISKLSRLFILLIQLNYYFFILSNMFYNLRSLVFLRDIFPEIGTSFHIPLEGWTECEDESVVLIVTIEVVIILVDWLLWLEVAEEVLIVGISCGQHIIRSKFSIRCLKQLHISWISSMSSKDWLNSSQAFLISNISLLLANTEIVVQQ